MKILFIIASLGSGGAERVLSNLSNYLCEKHDITIATFSNEEAFYDLDECVKHIKLDLLKPSFSLLGSIKNNLNRFFVLKKSIKKINADVNISFMTQTNILAILASKLLRRKIIVAERAMYNFYDSKVINFMRRVSYPFSNYVITQTIADSKHYNFIKKLATIYNPIFMNSSKSTKEKIILAVGRLDKNKGFDLLIEIFSTLETKGWKLIIAGDGVEKDSLINLLDKLNITNVELIGKCNNIFEYYAKSSIFVLSSKKEGFPNVLLEAMASGCAVIAFDCPYGPSEIIIHEKNAILVENQNREKLAHAMQKLMDSEVLRDGLSQEAVKVKEDYALGKIVMQWEEVIEKVITNG